MSPITTHILDTSLGRPAAGVAVSLARIDQNGEATTVGEGVTNSDGRVTDLLPPGGADAGLYRLAFETSGYFASTDRKTFYPRVEITFEIDDPSEHYHVPLLLTSHGYTTYRGS